MLYKLIKSNIKSSIYKLYFTNFFVDLFEENIILFYQNHLFLLLLSISFKSILFIYLLTYQQNNVLEIEEAQNDIQTNETELQQDFDEDIQNEEEFEEDPIIDREQIINNNKIQIQRISLQIQFFNASEFVIILLSIIYLLFYLDYLILLCILMAFVNILVGLILPRNHYLLITFTISMSRLGITCYLILCMIVDLIGNRNNQNFSFIISQIMRGIVSLITILQFIMSLIIVKSIGQFQEMRLPHMPLPGQEIKILKITDQIINSASYEINENFYLIRNSISTIISDIQQILNFQEFEEIKIKNK